MTRAKWTLVVLACLLMAGGAGLLLRLKAIQRLGKPGLKVAIESGTQKLRVLLPERVLQYSSTNLEPAEIETKTLPKDTTFAKRVYRAADGFQAALSVVMMGTDRTSIHKPEYCLTAQGWRIVKRETTAIRVAHPRPYSLPVRRFTTSLVTRGPNGEPVRWSGLYVFWFVADGRVTASHLARVGWITWDLLRSGVLPRWAYVSCFAACAPGQEEATFQRMKELIAASVPEFQSTTPLPTTTLTVAVDERPAAAVGK